MFVAQVLVNGTAIGSSGSSPKNWWWACGICFGIFMIFMMIDIGATETYQDCLNDAWTVAEMEECGDEDYDDTTAFAGIGSVSCCFSVIAGLVAISHGSKKATVVVQQMPQMYAQPVIQQVVQQPIQQRQPIQQQPQGQMPMQQQRQINQGNQQNLAQQAKNLEMARDFKGAADMYQKAGLFAEAGRVRQSHLEKDDKPMVQIGQVGDSVVKDSVVMGNTNQTMNCPSCGSTIQADWKFCPSCNMPL